MKDPEESKNEAAIRVIVDTLTDDKFSEKTRLNVVRGLKQTLNKCVPTLEARLINGCDIGFLFDAVSLAVSEGVANDGFQTEYFKFLLNASNNSELQDKIRLELLRILKGREINNSLITELWNVLSVNYLVWPDVIQEVLPHSKHFIEEKVFEWMTNFMESHSKLTDLDIAYFAELSIHSHDIFSMFTACFNEFVILTEGNEKMLRLVGYFTSLVLKMCNERGKANFKLYPREFRHIVPFLSIPPWNFSQESLIFDGFIYKSKVLLLLLNAFKKDQKTVLMLLTHYPKWLAEFTAYLEDNVR